MNKLSQEQLTTARARFFADGEITLGVRPEIANSWGRCRRLGVDPQSQPTPRFVESTRSSGLRRAADPVVSQLLRQIENDDAAMLLLNTDGVVVARWSVSRGIDRVLDSSQIEPGRIFDEASAGTSGLGTPLEDGRPAVIEGAEHTVAALDSLTAVGTPIIHPARGSLEGVIDIVAPVGAQPSLMVPLIARAAQDIGERLVSGYAADDRALMDAFLRAERRGPKRPLMAVNERVIIGNTASNELGVHQDHRLIWGAIQQALEQERDRFPVRFADGRELCGRVNAVGDSRFLGAIVRWEHQVRSAPAVPEPPEEGIARFSNETAFDRLERTAIRHALRQAGGNRSRAAQLLGVSRATLYRKIARLRVPD